MMKANRLASTALLLCLFLVPGCEKKKHSAPPSARNDLVARFFSSLKNGDSASAVIQGRKIQDMDPANEFVRRLVEVQEANEAIRATQRMVNAGNIDGALKCINQALERNPNNSQIERVGRKMRQLRNAKTLMRNMALAESASEMSAAMAACSTGLMSNMTPELKKYLDQYEKDIEKQRQLERSNAEKEKADSAARKAQLEKEHPDETPSPKRTDAK
ncbi:MAG: hypothetical protein MJ025_02060 [Victivallaceae bacterium]|nr:hypothetical protein [Victivallaceae bacterium]